MPASKRLVALRSLQAFEAVARCGSVAAAAGELGVSPGAVSQQLRKIEQALGACLLERKGKGLELTTWGRLYQADIAPAFEQLRQAQQRLWAARTQARLVLSCLSSVANRWIGPRLFDWQAAHPGAKVRLVGAEAEPVLGADAVDFRVTYGDAVRRYAHHAALFTDVAVLCAAAPTAARRWSNCAGTLPARHWPTSACRPTPPDRWC
jgi:LysR family glycine cleavage system transcriptional activator